MKQKVKKQPKKTLLFAAGRMYISPLLLTVKKKDGDYGDYAHYDCYGRLVLHVKERFPCFDSHDYLYENRYCHTYLIRHNGSWTAVKMKDESDEVTVEEGLNAQQAGERAGYWAKDLDAWLK